MIMELKEFMQKFLPDYKAMNERETIFALKTISDEEFDKLHFPEALQNFADRICYAQRDICFDTETQGYCVPNDVLYAKQPKIEEL
jgi:hypothetical protein